MNESLATIWTKVQWAEKHFGDFKDIVLGRSPGVDTRKATVIHYDLQRKPRSGPTNFLKPPREARLAFGDGIHQLRSSLDHIVYALVSPKTTDTRILRKIDFPIYADETLFKTSQSVKHLRSFLTPGQFAEVVSSQPYQRNRTAPHTDHLWILSELDNIDKHRTILVVAPRMMTFLKRADGTRQVVKQPFVPGTQDFSFPVFGPDEKVDVEQSDPYDSDGENGPRVRRQGDLRRMARPHRRR